MSMSLDFMLMHRSPTSKRHEIFDIAVAMGEPRVLDKFCLENNSVSDNIALTTFLIVARKALS